MAKTEIRVGGLGGQGVILCGMIIGKAAVDLRRQARHPHPGLRPRGARQRLQRPGHRRRRGDRVPLREEPRHAGADVARTPTPSSRRSSSPAASCSTRRSWSPWTTSCPRARRRSGIPATRFAEELGRRLVLNIVMAGFFAGVTGSCRSRPSEKAVKDSVPKGTEDLNMRAFRKGVRVRPRGARQGQLGRGR